MKYGLKAYSFLLIVLMGSGASMIMGSRQAHSANEVQINAEQAGVININSAGAEELQAIKGIGPALAERIMQYRQEHGQFEHVEDLANVKGIGKGKLEKMKSQITIA